MSPPSDLSNIERITTALLQIHKANFIERMVYLTISILSFIVLVVCAVIALINKQLDVTTFLALFAATGVIGVCITRVLAVWKDCVDLLKTVLLQETKK